VTDAEWIPLAVPTLEGNEAAYLQECIDTNFVSSVGPFVDRFEQAFAAYVGVEFAIACASGTAAIHIAMRLLGVSAGDDVLVPTLTFIASANPIVYERATPVFVDAEPETMNLDPAIVVDELAKRARLGRRQPAAIEVVHLLGHPADVTPILEASARYGVPVVEDASEALGATYVSGPSAGRQVGAVGQIGCFSFNGNKIITAGGGGMITTDDPALARRARHLTTQARLPGRTYRHDEVGYNYRLTNLAAAVGLAQLERLPTLLVARRKNAAAYDRAIAQLDGIEPAARAPWADPSFWLYTARLDAGPQDEVLDHLEASGIEARPVWSPLHRMAPFLGAPLLGGSVAESMSARAFCLPSSSNLRPHDLGRISRALREAIESR